MDPREIEAILYQLEDEKADLVEYLQTLDIRLKDTTTSEEDRSAMEEDRLQTLEDIRELDRDIAMYTELKDRLFPAEIGECGFYCDGLCPQCKNYGYDPRTEVMTDGDY